MSVLTPQHYPVAASGVFTTSVAPRVEIGGQLLGPSLLTRAQSGPQLGVTTAVPAGQIMMNPSQLQQQQQQQQQPRTGHRIGPVSF